MKMAVGSCFQYLALLVDRGIAGTVGHPPADGVNRKDTANQGIVHFPVDLASLHG